MVATSTAARVSSPTVPERASVSARGTLHGDMECPGRGKGAAGADGLDRRAGVQ